MQEHPVPQNITAYEFHLIGSMTIKQFLILLAGGGIALFFYSTNLPGIIKWPLAILGVGAGILMAFVPYEERTLDQWFVNFLRAIYRPTKYYWRRQAEIPGYFTHKVTVNTAALYKPDVTPLKQTQVSQYLSSLHQPTEVATQDSLDLFQDPSAVLGLFDQVSAAIDVLPSANALDSARPSLVPRSRPLGGRAPQVVYVTPQSQSEPAPVSPHSEIPLEVVGQILSEEREEESPEPEPSQRSEVQITHLETVNVQPQTALPESPASSGPVAPTSDTAYLPTQSAEHVAGQTVPAIFDRSLPFPSLPTTPNLLIGMVRDTAKAIIPNAIVEILDSNGNTVRAMKTNSLGQFYISSPLQPGTYTLETEHDGHAFPIYSFTINDTVLDPIDIQATG